MAVAKMNENEKDIEILVLRQQLRIVERRQERGPSIPRWQKVPLVALALQLKARGSEAHQRLKSSIILFKPDTVLYLADIFYRVAARHCCLEARTLKKHRLDVISC